MTTQLSDSMKENKNLKQKVMTLEDSLKEYKGKVGTLEKELNNMKNTIRDRDQQITRLQNDYEKVQQECLSLRKKVNARIIKIDSHFEKISNHQNSSQCSVTEVL